MWSQSNCLKNEHQEYTANKKAHCSEEVKFWPLPPLHLTVVCSNQPTWVTTPSCWHSFPTLHSVTLHWQLVIGHVGVLTSWKPAEATDQHLFFFSRTPLLNIYQSAIEYWVWNRSTLRNINETNINLVQ